MEYTLITLIPEIALVDIYCACWTYYLYSASSKYSIDWYYAEVYD